MSAVCQRAALTARALVFHALNYLLGVGGFSLVIFGLALSLGFLALCCVGVLVFRALLLATPQLVKLDVALHNFMAPADRQLCERESAMSNESAFLARRTSLMAAVYLATAKLGTGILSVLVLAMAFALPINALTSASFREEYLTAGRAAYVELVVTALALLIGGLALMPFVARLSCATTRFFCCEAMCTHTYYTAMDAARSSTPSTRSTKSYGTR